MHSINAYVLKDDFFFRDVPHGQLNEVDGVKYILVPITEALLKKLGVSHTDEAYKVKIQIAFLDCGDFAWVETDYFGGAGDQSARAWVGRVAIPIPGGATINGALCLIGIKKKDDLDEFDTIGLNRYRSNDDITEDYEKRNGKTKLEIERRFLLKRLPRMINPHFSKNIVQYYTVKDGEPIRVRHEVDQDVFYITKKKNTTNPIVKEETEWNIEKEEFNTLSALATSDIKKKRYEIEYSGELWEIDDFDPEYGKLIIAEIEMPTADYDLTIPEEIREVLIMEVSGIKEFSNVSLSKPILHSKPIPRTKNIAVTIMECPKCHTEMEEIKADGPHNYKCPKCQYLY